ncbi:hypothetical protein EDB92DRAFT_1257612 [Lactarius akahatsu]|uniref:Uncharacterized protein n=1 Tax=Lactarius akahatsu TaxID=416441 RepID=A0AAD4LCB7_9AGAM|nr:hypothetical protein EDB92DRAFT_1257612 [Lactarius akahatsu]
MKLNEAALEAQALRSAWMRRWALGRTSLPSALAFRLRPSRATAPLPSSISSLPPLMRVGNHAFLMCGPVFGGETGSDGATQGPRALHSFAIGNFSPIGFTSVCVLHKELLREIHYKAPFSCTCQCTRLLSAPRFSHATPPREDHLDSTMMNVAGWLCSL